MGGATEKRESSVAWFRLAELISRGEKEKALNLYRLLSHSFDDRAYALQVEGDILWSFEDNIALDKYKQAAFLYKKEQKVTAAMSVYEHLLTLQPNNYEVIGSLLIVYIKLDWLEKVKNRFDLAKELFKSNKISTDQMWEVVQCMVDTAIEEAPRKLQECGIKNIVKLIQKIVPELKDKTKHYCLQRELEVNS
jgi:tetratricopeptide (TPR) repeat protein